MDKVIHKHLDNQDTLNDQVKKSVEGYLGKLSINDLLSDPEAYLLNYLESVATLVINEFAEQFIQEGQQFAKELEAKRQPIEVPSVP